MKREDLTRIKQLTARQKAQNKLYSSVRHGVGRTFGLLKRHHGLAKARYLGLHGNKARAELIAMSYHLKTGLHIFKPRRQIYKKWRGW